MKIIINSIQMNNFQKHLDKFLDFGSKQNELMGINGTGKTTVLHAICWCLFGKNYFDETKFNIKPINTETGEELEIDSIFVKLNVSVFTGENDEEEMQYLFVREIAKDKLKCSINEAPYKAGEFSAKVNEILGLENDKQNKEFKTLFNPNYTVNLHWQELRTLIMGFVSGIGNEDILNSDSKFNPIKNSVLTVGTDKFKKALSEKKSIINNQNKPTLQGRIQQQQIKVNELKEIASSVESLEQKKTELTSLVTEYDLRLKNEQVKQDKINEKINELNVLKNEIQVLENTKQKVEIDGKSTQLKIDSKQNIDKIKQEQIYPMKSKLLRAEAELENINRNISLSTQRVQQGVDKFNLEKAKPLPNIESKCIYCGQDLPEEKIKEVQAKLHEEKVKRLMELKGEVEKENSDLKKLKESLKDKEFEIQSYQNKVNELENKDYTEFIDNSEVKELINQKSKLQTEWLDICRQIKEKQKSLIVLETEIKEMPHPIQIEPITKITEELMSINIKLQKTEHYSGEMEQLQKLQEEFNKIDEDLIKIEILENLLKEFNNKKSEIIAKELSKYFKITKFITSETTNDGREMECLKLSLDNKPYESLSNGEQILISLDLCNGIQKIKNKRVPMLIDSLGELSRLPELDTQTIGCRCVEITGDEKRNEYFSSLRLIKKA